MAKLMVRITEIDADDETVLETEVPDILQGDDGILDLIAQGLLYRSDYTQVSYYWALELG